VVLGGGGGGTGERCGDEARKCAGGFETRGARLVGGTRRGSKSGGGAGGGGEVVKVCRLGDLGRVWPSTGMQHRSH
jgi:hypothetical protein